MSTVKVWLDYCRVYGWVALVGFGLAMVAFGVGVFHFIPFWVRVALVGMFSLSALACLVICVLAAVATRLDILAERDHVKSCSSCAVVGRVVAGHRA